MTPWARSTLTAAVVATVIAGCSFSATFEPPRFYRLQAVNDIELPAAPGFGVTILSGSLELELDGDCLHRQTVRIGTGGGATEEVREVPCTWSRSGDDLELTIEPGDFELTMEGTFRGERLILTRDTGIRCVTTPCPSTWVEEYLRDRTAN